MIQAVAPSPVSANLPKKPATDAECWKLAYKNRGLVYNVLDTKFSWLFNSEKSEVMDRDDYFQEGIQGAFNAAKSWDPKKGKYSTHAYYWIFQAISRAHRAKHFKGARVAYGVYEVISKVKKNSPKNFEQVILKTCRQNVIDGYQALTNVTRLDAPPIDEEGFSSDEANIFVTELVSQERNNVVFDRKNLREILEIGTVRLSELQRNVLFLKFGIDGEALTTLAIAKRLHIMRRQVQSESYSAMRKLRRFFSKNKITKDSIQDR